MMADRPILFSAPMVRAILNGTKTQTRRAFDPPPQDLRGEWVASTIGGTGITNVKGDPVAEKPCLWFERTGAVISPRYAIGDRLWVRETWRTHKSWDGVKPNDVMVCSPIWYEADGRDNCDQHGKTRVSIHMPRWASRLTLTVTDVRVERLQDISRADAIAEGILVGPPLSSMPESLGDIYHDGVTDPIDGWTRDPVEAYRTLWNHINGPEAWDANPWVVAVTYDVAHGNIDALAKATGGDGATPPIKGADA